MHFGTRKHQYSISMHMFYFFFFQFLMQVMFTSSFFFSSMMPMHILVNSVSGLFSKKSIRLTDLSWQAHDQKQCAALGQTSENLNTRMLKVTQRLGYMALTEGIAHFEFLVAGPGGVIRPHRPAGRVADGVLGRRRRHHGAAHEEQSYQGQRRSHCSSQNQTKKGNWQCVSLCCSVEMQCREDCKLGPLYA